jgi:hypothetical protein
MLSRLNYIHAGDFHGYLELKIRRYKLTKVAWINVRKRGALWLIATDGRQSLMVIYGIWKIYMVHGSSQWQLWEYIQPIATCILLYRIISPSKDCSKTTPRSFKKSTCALLPFSRRVPYSPVVSHSPGLSLWYEYWLIYTSLQCLLLHRAFQHGWWLQGSTLWAKW